MVNPQQPANLPSPPLTDKPAQQHIAKHYTAQAADAGKRVDQVAANVFSEFSRKQLQDWLQSGELTINGEAQKPKYRLKGGEKLQLTTILTNHSEDLPEKMPLDVRYTDDDVLVLNKPVGLVVHPGAGNWTGTLVNGLLYHYPSLQTLPRAGLVHRIDKDTSGLILVAKNKPAQLTLMAQLKDKHVYREYQAIVCDKNQQLYTGLTINAAIARHPSQRTKMSVQATGKSAVTHIQQVTPLVGSFVLVHIRLETGRTHQIRVHMAHVGCPLVGDAVYGNGKLPLQGLTVKQQQAVCNFNRQALHAHKLGFTHPSTGKQVAVTAKLAPDMANLLVQLT